MGCTYTRLIVLQGNINVNHAVAIGQVLVKVLDSFQRTASADRTARAPDLPLRRGKIE